MGYKHLVFDIDGTLLDSRQADQLGLQATVARFLGKTVDTEELTFALGIPGEVVLKKLGIEDVKAAGELWNSYFSKYAHTITLFDGVRELLPELAGMGYTLGVVTSKTPQGFAHDFEPHGVSHYFGTVICVTDSPRPKPSPDPLLAYLERTGAKPEEVIYIGDTVYDSQCARDAGVDFGLAEWGSTASDGMDAKYRFEIPGDILRICCRANGVIL